jgi:site-specific DNA-methyltransferase (adenine-specific)
MTDLASNVLYDGDNLDILRRYLPETCVDLVVLDPHHATDAQLLAFEDTWHWGPSAEAMAT